MKGIQKEFKYWSQLLLLPLYALSHLFPKNKKLWVFGSFFGNRFADNPKYFYLYLAQHKRKQLQVVWISRNREITRFLNQNGYESYYLYSVKGIWNSLRAGVYLYDNYTKDICYATSGRALKINLWHGIPLKKIQKDNVFDYYRNPRTLVERLHSIPRRITDEKSSHFVLATSPSLKNIFSSAFHTERILVGGYPRNDVLINDAIKVLSTNSEKAIIERIHNWKRKSRIILYMPTFRESENKFFEVIDLVRFQAFLRKENVFFLVKLHPKSKLYDSFSQIKQDNIYIIDPQDDPYPILKHIDVLLTDYSSIYFDFLHVNKPIIFFSYDYSEYLSTSRELYFEYDKFTPGIKVYNQAELELAILSEDSFHDERERIKSIVFEASQDKLGCEELYSKITNLLRVDRMG